MDALIDTALAALGIERLVLAVHDASFPCTSRDDSGRGSPAGQGALDLLAFARDLGFRGLQLGPQGETSLGNPSPYDGAVFSRNVASLALGGLDDEAYAGAFDPRAIEGIVQCAPAGSADRAAHVYAFTALHTLVKSAAITVRRRADDGDTGARALVERIEQYRAQNDPRWLAHDTLFEAFSAEHGTDDWRAWPAGDRAPSAERMRAVETRHADVAFAYAFGQHVLARQHAAMRAHARSLGVTVWGDFQVGLSLRDRWRRDALFLPRWRMGAPPSRTNPDGQPWGYSILDPRQIQRRFIGDGPSAPLSFLRARLGKLFDELDGVRIDHPHGLVCPWIYDGNAPDPAVAVRAGMRAFESPEATEPEVAALALVSSGQIDASAHKAWDDDWVRSLTGDQVDEYARMFDLVVDSARERGRTVDDVACEVLSTCPLPLEYVMKRHGFGRFRVTQKANPDDPRDGYRSEHAEPHDWMMLGNHDTEPILRVIDRWTTRGTLNARAAYLADRLEPTLGSRRQALAAAIVSDPRKLLLALFAELFASRAKSVLVFFADLFGERAIYNQPGVVSSANWNLRVPRDFRAAYAERRARGEALDVPGALAVAMRARGSEFVRAHWDVVNALEARAAFLLP